MNIVILKGNVGKDPKIREMQSGSFATFSLATNKKWKDKTGNLQEKTEWHDILINSVNQAKYITKGMTLVVQGEIRYSRRDDKFFSTIVAKNIEFRGGGKKQNQFQYPDADIKKMFEGGTGGPVNYQPAPTSDAEMLDEGGDLLF